MCHPSCIDFVKKHLEQKNVAGKSVLEVGAYNVNGTVRSVVSGMNPSSYVGVDIEMGPGVDLVCDAGRLVERFGENAFDILLCTEMLEHVKNWRKVVSNLKKVIKPGGLLIITTRSKGFVYHGYPYDFWRFEITDFRDIFCDLSIESLESDPILPGVFLKAKKPVEFKENNLRNKSIYSIITESKRIEISFFDVLLFRVQCRIGPFLAKILPSTMKSLLKNLYYRLR